MHSDAKNTDIEALRAYAIGITFVAHLHGLVPAWGPALTVFWLGGGVDLFFAVSGFLIVQALMRSLDENPPFATFAVRFWVRRIFRLWPAALFWSTVFALLFVFVIWRGDPALQGFMFKSWLFATLNLENLYIWACASSGATCRETPLWHYWSLSLEEQFYAVMPLLLFAVRRRHLLVLPLLALAAAQSFTVRPWGELLWFIRTDALMYGIVVALLWDSYGETMRRLFAAIPRFAWQAILAAAALALVFLSAPAVSPLFMGFVAMSAGVIVLVTSADRNLITAHPTVRRAALYLGSRSYSIYLVHNPVISIAHAALFRSGWLDVSQVPHQIAAVLAAIGATLLLAEFSVRVIEDPLRRLGRQLTSGKRRSTETRGLTTG